MSNGKTNKAMERFQELVRDLSITGVDIKEKYFYNGWSQVVAMKMALPQFVDSLSDEQHALVRKVVAELDTIDHERNVRGPVKEVLRYPHFPGYPPWEDYSDDAIAGAFSALSGRPHTLKVTHDNKIYLMLPEDLPYDVRGHIENDEEPHFTLVNSDKFDPEVHGKLDGKVIQDLEYAGLAATLAMDWPPFRNIIVVKCISERIWREFGKKELHYTVKREKRKPHVFGQYVTF